MQVISYLFGVTLFLLRYILAITLCRQLQSSTLLVLHLQFRSPYVILSEQYNNNIHLSPLVRDSQVLSVGEHEYKLIYLCWSTCVSILFQVGEYMCLNLLESWQSSKLLIYLCAASLSVTPSYIVT